MSASPLETLLHERETPEPVRPAPPALAPSPALHPTPLQLAHPSDHWLVHGGLGATRRRQLPVVHQISPDPAAEFALTS